MDIDSPWNEDAGEDSTRDAEWTKMSMEFTNAGYREGITAGKECALQEGFDSGFELVGAPIGRELGILRGISSGLVSYLTSSGGEDHPVLSQARDIASKLGDARLSDLAPRDFEAEEHAKQHLEDDEEFDIEGLNEKRKMERLEDMLAQLNSSPARPTAEDTSKLRDRLKALCEGLELSINWDLNH